MAKKRAGATTAPADQEQKPLVELSEEEQWRIIRDSGVLQTIQNEGASPKPREPEELLSPFTLEVFAALALIVPFSCLLLMMEMCVPVHLLALIYRVRSSLVHYQYGRKPTYEALADRMIPGVPSEYQNIQLIVATKQLASTIIQSSPLPFSIVRLFHLPFDRSLTPRLANRYKYTWQMQASFFILGCMCGARLIYMINWANWKDNMKMVRFLHFLHRGIRSSLWQLPPLSTAWVYAIAQLNLGPSVVSLLFVGLLTRYKGWKLSF